MRGGASISTRKRLLLMGCALALTGGCAQVQPWQRETLARPEMALDPHPAQIAAMNHAHESREGASGSASASGGGCGCD